MVWHSKNRKVDIETLQSLIKLLEERLNNQITALERELVLGLLARYYAIINSGKVGDDNKIIMPSKMNTEEFYKKLVAQERVVRESLENNES